MRSFARNAIARSFLPGFCGLAASLAASTFAPAAEAASITGTVTGPDTVPIPTAVVEVTNTETGQFWRVGTSDAGRYFFGMVTIGAADWFGLPVSTTHVLSSGVAGTMAANHSGLQWGTVRNMLMAWVRYVLAWSPCPWLWSKRA